MKRKYRYGVDEVKLRGHFDCGKARSHYVLMSLTSESNWNQYMEVVENANVFVLRWWLIYVIDLALLIMLGMLIE